MSIIKKYLVDGELYNSLSEVAETKKVMLSKTQPAQANVWRITDGLQGVRYVGSNNDAMVVYEVELTSYDFVLWLSSRKTAQTFKANDYWFGFLKDSDVAIAEELGLTVDTYTYDDGTTVRCIRYDSTNYDHEIIGLYSDDEGTTLVYDTVSNLSVGTGKSTIGTLATSLEILNTTAISTSSKTWKVRITKKEAE